MNTAPTNPNDRTLVITGSCGFIGLNLRYHLASKGRFSRYVIVDNLSVGTVADLEGVLGELGPWKAEDPNKYTLEPGTVELRCHDIRTTPNRPQARTLRGAGGNAAISRHRGYLPEGLYYTSIEKGLPAFS